MEELQFNPLASKFLTPFDESEISERKGAGNKTFSYVDPEKYRRRLLSAAESGFTVHFDNLVMGKDGVTATLHLIVEADMVKYDVKVSGYQDFEKYKDFEWNSETKKYDKPNPKAGQVIDKNNDIKKLKSELLKSALTECGLGLHLYYRVAQKADGTAKKATPSSNGESKQTAPAPAAQSSAPSSTPSSDGWDGSAEIKFGKHKGTAYKDLPDDYIEWASSKENPDAGAQKEQKRRSSNASEMGAQEAAASLSEDEEVPF